MFLQNARDIDKDVSALATENSDTVSVLIKLTKEIRNDDTAELCCYQLLNHVRWKDILFGIFNLLANKNDRISGNAAYIIGSICKFDVGKSRIVDVLLDGQHKVVEEVLSVLNNILASKQEESVMNALGTIATIADNKDGRVWLLRKFELDDSIELSCALVVSDNEPIANNASLFLGRLTVDEEGCARILNIRCSRKIFLHLIDGLICDKPNRAMNAAFALGRLFQLESGQRNLLKMKQADNMVQYLIDMLFSEDFGCQKNSSFALQSLASGASGCNRLLEHKEKERMFNRVVELLQEDKMALFAAYFLQSIVLHKKGCIFIRDHPRIKLQLQAVMKSPTPNKELNDELQFVLECTADLEKQNPPIVTVESATSVTLYWTKFYPKNGFEVYYHVLQDSEEIYVGKNSELTVPNLKPNRDYHFSMHISSEGVSSPLSENSLAKMPESIPSAPTNVHVISRSTSQLKICWDEPIEPNGELKGYILSIVGKSITVELKDNSYLFINLMPNTKYHFEVCAVTCKGPGECASLVTSTHNLSVYAPSKPVLRVLGRTEIHVSWDPPQHPLGRLNYYDVRMNNQVIYNGVDRNVTARSLIPGKEYTFTVSAWTSEGRCESETSSRKTPKQYKRKDSIKKLK